MNEGLKASYNETYNSVQLWIKNHQDQYQNYVSIIISDEEKGFVPFEHHKNSLFNYYLENIYIILNFNKSINYSMNVDELQKSIRYITLEKIPLPNFIIPNGWDVYLHSVIRSIDNNRFINDELFFKNKKMGTNIIGDHEIKILSFKNGKIKIHIKTDFSNIYGSLKTNINIGCGPAPKGTKFNIKKYLKGDIYINLPFESKE